MSTVCLTRGTKTQLVYRYAESASDDERRILCAAIVEAYQPFIFAVARIYSGGAVETEDLQQISTLGFLKSLERFDPNRGESFKTYAELTMKGEIKHHFRDRSRRVHVPRDLYELQYRIAKLNEAAIERGKKPHTSAELAERLGESLESVEDAEQAQMANKLVWLDEPDKEGGEKNPLADSRSLFVERLADRLAVEAAIQSLPPKEKTLLFLRFVRELNQTEIGNIIGVSQMQVSRLLQKTLALLAVTLEQSAKTQEIAPATPEAA